MIQSYDSMIQSYDNFKMNFVARRWTRSSMIQSYDTMIQSMIQLFNRMIQ